MLVKEIIRTSAEYLDMKNIIKFIDGEIESNEEILDDINNFVLAVNMVNNSIASSYIELVGSILLTPNINNQISYKDISEKSIIEIKKVTGNNGEEIKFKITPDGVVVDKNSLCEIEYSYFPSRVDLSGEIDYYTRLNDMTFAMGVVAEYLYIKGNIDDAYSWDKKFKNTIFNLLRPRRNIVLPNKGW